MQFYMGIDATYPTHHPGLAVTQYISQPTRYAASSSSASEQYSSNNSSSTNFNSSQTSQSYGGGSEYGNGGTYGEAYGSGTAYGGGSQSINMDVGNSDAGESNGVAVQNQFNSVGGQNAMGSNEAIQEVQYQSPPIVQQPYGSSTYTSTSAGGQVGMASSSVFQDQSPPIVKQPYSTTSSTVYTASVRPTTTTFAHTSFPYTGATIAISPRIGTTVLPGSTMFNSINSHQSVGAGATQHQYQYNTIPHIGIGSSTITLPSIRPTTTFAHIGLPNLGTNIHASHNFNALNLNTHGNGLQFIHQSPTGIGSLGSASAIAATGLGANSVSQIRLNGGLSNHQYNYRIGSRV